MPRQPSGLRPLGRGMVHSHTGIFILSISRKERRYSVGRHGQRLGGFSPDGGGPGGTKGGPRRPSPLNRGKTKGRAWGVMVGLAPAISAR
jgi:hypothetical protein